HYRYFGIVRRWDAHGETAPAGAGRDQAGALGAGHGGPGRGRRVGVGGVGGGRLGGCQDADGAGLAVVGAGAGGVVAGAGFLLYGLSPPRRSPGRRKSPRSPGGPPWLSRALGRGGGAGRP